MRKLLSITSFALLLTASQALAAPITGGDTAPAEATASVGTSMIGPAPADKAKIVFFRPSKFAGGAVGFKVREGETELGKLRSGKYFVSLVAPGAHQYTVHSET